MKIIPGHQASALKGLHDSLQAVERAADQIAGNAREAAPDSATRTEAMVELKQAELQGKAALKVLETGNDLLGNLLDTRA